MSTDHAERERVFLTGLEADTGRDLAGWMVAITREALPHRNDTIDWLRVQGFTFAWASWLERIHANGGRPLYIKPEDIAPAIVAAPAIASTEACEPIAEQAETIQVIEEVRRVANAPRHVVAVVSAMQGSVPHSGAEPSDSLAAAQALLKPQAKAPLSSATILPLRPPYGASPTSSAVSDPGKTSASPSSASLLSPRPGEPLDDLLARAKAYRPLAQLVLREIAAVVPALCPLAESPFIVLAAPRPFAALWLSHKEVRLGLALDRSASRRGQALPRDVVKAKLSAAAGRFPDFITHMIVLTDARRVDGDLLALIATAHARVNEI